MKKPEKLCPKTLKWVIYDLNRDAKVCAKYAREAARKGHYWTAVEDAASAEALKAAANTFETDLQNQER